MISLKFSHKEHSSLLSAEDNKKILANRAQPNCTYSEMSHNNCKIKTVKVSEDIAMKHSLNKRTSYQQLVTLGHAPFGLFCIFQVNLHLTGTFSDS